MDTLPAEIVDYIASYLNKNDLVNFATVNSEYNNILSKRVAYEKEKYNYDRYINHNRMVTLMYIKDKNRQYYMRKYYKRCIICGCEVGYGLMNENIVFCFKCKHKVSEDIKEKLDKYLRNTCDCIMREVRMMILNNVDESKINEMFTLETRSNFNHDEGAQCLEVLYSYYAPVVFTLDRLEDSEDSEDSEDEYEDDDDDEE